MSEMLEKARKYEKVERCEDSKGEQTGFSLFQPGWLDE